MKEPRIRATRSQWEALNRRKSGKCAVCRRRIKTTLHHLVPRSLGGDDVWENLLELCGDGTRGCHGGVEGRDRRILTMVRSVLRVDQLAYMHRKKGPYFVERYYPNHD